MSMEMEISYNEIKKMESAKQSKESIDLANQNKETNLINEEPTKDLNVNPNINESEIRIQANLNSKINENSAKIEKKLKSGEEKKTENKDFEKMKVQRIEKAAKTELKNINNIGVEETKEKKKKEEQVEPKVQEEQEELEEKIITFDINSLIFLIESEFSEEILKNSEAIINISKCQAIFIEEKDIGPDSKFCACRIKAKNFKRSCKALKMVLKNYSEYLNLKHGKIEEFEILIHYLVPINALSSVIGKEGTRIKKVKKESEVKIYADKVNEYFKYMRSIKMQSMSDEKILKAVNMIQEFVREEIDFEQKSIKNKKENYRTIQSNFRIMLTRDEAKYIIKNLDLPKLCEKRKLMIDIKEEPDNAIIEKGNYIATIKGRSKDIDHGICNFCEILEEFFQKTSKEIKLSILVSKNNTGVIIGPEGSTIRTIATQSGGAKINVEPLKLMKPVSEGNKAEERIIIIRGRLIAREIAASLIKDKIEQTKLENLSDIKLEPQYLIKAGGKDYQKLNKEKSKNLEIKGKKAKIKRSCSRSSEGEPEKMRDSSREESSVRSRKSIRKNSRLEENNRNRSREKKHTKNKKEVSRSKSNRGGSSDSNNEENVNENINVNTKNAIKSKSSSKSFGKNEAQSKHSSKASSLYKMEDVKEEKNLDEMNLKSEEVIRKNYYRRRENRGEASRNISFEEKGKMKIAMNILVPKYLTPLLIGKNGASVREMENKTNATITFWKKDIPNINLENEEDASIVQLMGTTGECLEAFKTIMKRIMVLESTLNDKKIGRM